MKHLAKFQPELRYCGAMQPPVSRISLLMKLLRSDGYLHDLADQINVCGLAHPHVALSNFSPSAPVDQLPVAHCKKAPGRGIASGSKPFKAAENESGQVEGIYQYFKLTLSSHVWYAT